VARSRILGSTGVIPQEVTQMVDEGRPKLGHGESGHDIRVCIEPPAVVGRHRPEAGLFQQGQGEEAGG
jgi:hypothetical protein